MEQLNISSNDFTQFINLFDQKYQGKQEISCWVLEEPDSKANYKECVLKNGGKSLLVKTDSTLIQWSNILHHRTKDIHRKCDYVLISRINEKLYIFFIEMKGDELKTARKQVNNTYFYFLYLMKLILHNTSLPKSISVNYKGIILCSSNKIKLGIKASKLQAISDNQTELKYFILGQLDELDFNSLDLDS